MSQVESRQLMRLAALVQIEKRARAADPAELGFIMVNETMGLLPYRQALLWQQKPRGKVIAASGITTPDQQAPYIVWAQRLCAHLSRTETARSGDIHQFVPADLPTPLGEEWDEWMAPHLVWIPLGPGALVLGRDEPLSESDRALLSYVADAYGHAWRASLLRARVWKRDSILKSKSQPDSQNEWKRRGLITLLILILVAGAFYPVRQSVLAPAEIIPLEPTMVRAPLDGVVDQVLVRPNETVAEGQLLFSLDARLLRNQLEVSSRALDAATTELRQARQAAVMDPAARASLPTLQGKLEQQQAEVDYLNDKLTRIEIRATREGLAVFDDPNDWRGRPVAVGERVMLVADPAKVEIEARLPVADAIDLEIGTPVRLFLNIAPERAYDATLTFVSYQSQKGADGILGYRIKALLNAAEELPPRIGLKGTAKLYGAKVPLVYFLFRRPVAAARQWLGL